MSDTKVYEPQIRAVCYDILHLRLIDFVSLNLRLKDSLGPVTRVKKKKNILHPCHRETEGAGGLTSGVPIQDDNAVHTVVLGSGQNRKRR